ncbi:unnamed protein product [Coffea canephora]|uniref:Ribosomal protein L34Ae n=1 Tax=Coffea canephora TaxID=49390 RepID=A0A068TWB5_COFCA|nr:unnamed protein product [Coffea canephora]
MARQVFFTLKSRFSFVDERFLNELLHRTMFRYGHFLWVWLCNFMLNIFWLMVKYTHRVNADEAQENVSKFNVNHSQEDGEVISKTSMGFDSDFTTQKESSNLTFSLRSQKSADSKEQTAETEDSAFLQSGFRSSTRKYQFMAAGNLREFMEEPEIRSFTIQEMFEGSDDGLIQNSDGRVIQDEDEIKSSSEVQDLDRCSNASSNGDGLLIELRYDKRDDIEESTTKEETPEEEIADHLLETPFSEEILESKQRESSAQNKVSTYEELDDEISYEVQLLQRDDSSDCFSEPELENSFDESLAGNHEVPSRITEVPSSDAKDSEIFASTSPMISNIDRNPEISERCSSGKEVINGNLCTVGEADDDIEDDYIELEPRSKDANKADETILSRKDESLFELAHAGGKETQLMDDRPQNFQEESLGKESWESNSDDEDEFDILLEHQQLVKQMKMERKNSMARGLPTISENEDCETPKVLDYLKPLKIDEKFEYKDLMEEIQKFYKSYAEKTRKLDILNYQTLHAISFLQHKDSQLFIPSKRSLLSSIKPFSLPSISMSKQRRIYADPTLKSITEMHRDLELVYVGHICLSWEILQWQHGKVKELLEYDSQGNHCYNQVAGEYQQFQVLVQRFLEDERFNGPRIQHFVKSRCACRGLLQVPIIKDDCFKDKKETTGDEIDAISISMLAQTLKESMHIFWEFLRADKEEADGILKSVQGSLADPRAAVDSELLTNVRTRLEKKERKLKDIQRSVNCIVKRFQKQQAGQTSNALLISQVELKLVSRVLSLPRLTTDHLIWCQKKLDNINIVNRKICVEPAFLLFPC